MDKPDTRMTPEPDPSAYPKAGPAHGQTARTIAAMINDGWKARAIASALNVSTQTVYYHARRLGLEVSK